MFAMASLLFEYDLGATKKSVCDGGRQKLLRCAYRPKLSACQAMSICAASILDRKVCAAFLHDVERSDNWRAFRSRCLCGPCLCRCCRFRLDDREISTKQRLQRLSR